MSNANQSASGKPARLLTLGLLLLALAAALGLGWLYRAELMMLIAGGGPPGQRGRPPPLVETEPVRQRRVEQRITATGTLTAPESVTVTARSRGRVAEVLFEEGNRVSTGDPLLRLERERAAARVDEAEAQLAEARRDLNRLRELKQNDFVSASDLEQAEAAAESAAAALAVAEEDLEDRVVDAPFTGVVGRRLVSPGALLEPGTPVADLRRSDPLDLLLDVPETALARIAKGQRVQATTPAYPERTFSGEVTFVGTQVDPQLRTLPVEATFANPEGALKPGMFLQAALLSGEQSLLTVPEAAVIARGPTEHLFVLESPPTAAAAGSAAGASAGSPEPNTASPPPAAAPGEPQADGAGPEPPKVRRRTVQTGLRRDGWVAVTDGVSAGEQVVVSGLQGLRDGAAVRTGPPPGAGAGNPNKAPQAQP
ncbi:hypothetical protein CKO31_03905 [Thiohalocapsa halophila]|uniref:Efflux RND transporter periplasmic adaptor subunit n=1 Tax=Thiohalocapsa halophila TaxID=69359 RepID=A0ABS1CDD6_9GAMM|nr:efflux RND transporter periplasmic adaptor subunit [Thiohalocapsa halophila]MBK1629899.1 hypothetical protein [Thiohalocapsa halophila]